ncbi:PAS domain-containing protein [Novosphingobium sp. P6W]|uniref:PAS domain S-box protein n=1 Tax=Novosphingobium sp. P6W TaxID=1609758 RepID=UPI0005C2D087|nr:PAS domain-containing protein [Novosphingobium sp. P6W]AXB79270.1 PAS domain S-box protein [Novosphingobium sp. P6W]KIS31842.1 histidine kinase [Novosphingobium sp. P6W]
MTDAQGDEIPAELRAFFDDSPTALSLASVIGDHPLVYVNRKFVDLTGYSAEEILGRNCRVLQRDVDDREARSMLSVFLLNEDAEGVRTPIVNFRKDGTAFVNLLYLSRLRAPAGQTRYFFASQFDISRVQPQRLNDYDRELRRTLTRLARLAADSGLIVEEALATIADAAATIAQAKLTLVGLEDCSAR